jgi:hypothetical protein
MTTVQQWTRTRNWGNNGTAPNCCSDEACELLALPIDDRCHSLHIAATCYRPLPCKVTDVIRLSNWSAVTDNSTFCMPHYKNVFLLPSTRLCLSAALSTTGKIWGDYEAYRLLGCGDVSEERVASIFRAEEVPRARKRFRRMQTDYTSAALREPLEGEVRCGKVKSTVSAWGKRGGGGRELNDWRWRRHVPPQRRFTMNPQGATFQKTVFLIIIIQLVGIFPCLTSR